MKRARSSKVGAATVPFSKRLPREFFAQPALELSKALVGKVLARKLPDGQILRAVIVETEAYPGGEFNIKKSERNAAMFMEPGTVYVYLTYGMHHCINISAQEEDGACLLRALEPLEDYESMRSLRERPAKTTKKNPSPSTQPSKKGKRPLKIYELANGPGKLCAAMDINREACNKLHISDSEVLWVEESGDDRFLPGNFKLEEATRIGIDSAPAKVRNQLYRFFIQDNLAVSTAKPNQIIKRLELEQEEKE